MTDRVCGCGHLQTQHHGPCAECRCPMWHPDHQIVDATINEKWTLRLPDYRAYRPSWAWHEAARFGAMHSVIRPGDTVYEIGAEQGDHAALYCSWGARVVLVEPNPAAWPSIKASMEANGYEPEAWWVGFCGDHDWRVDDDPIENGGRYGRRGKWPACASDPLEAAHGFQSLAEHGDVTPGKTLRSLYAAGLPRPDVISIDVEGGELNVVSGFGDEVWAVRPVVFISVHRQLMNDWYGLDAEELFEMMGDHGYESTFLATDHEEHYVFSHPKGRRVRG